MGGGISGLLPKRESFTRLLVLNSDDLSGYIDSEKKLGDSSSPIVNEMTADIAKILSTFGNKDAENVAKYLLSGHCVIKNILKPIGLVECLMPSVAEFAIDIVTSNIKPAAFKRNVDTLVATYDARCQYADSGEKTECLRALGELKRFLNIIP